MAHLNVGRARIQNFAEAFVRARDSPTKPRQGSSSAHPFQSGRAAVQANPFALRIQLLDADESVSASRIFMVELRFAGEASCHGNR